MKITKYPSLNGLRAISIILVILHHLSIQTDIFKTDKLWLKPLYFFTDGHLGVNVFFVISGFLITNLLIQEELHTKTLSLKNFYIRRTLRIFPAYFSLLLVYFILQLAGYIYLSNASWLTSITYTKYFNCKLDWYTSHGWSLSIEEHFYLFWPFVFLAGEKLRKRIAIFLVAIVPVNRVAIELIYPNHSIWTDFTILTRIDAIAIGCVFALYQEQIIDKLSKHWNKIFYSSVILLFILYLIRGYAKLHPSFDHHFGFIFIPLGYTHGTIANILIAFIMMYSIFGTKGGWFKFLNLGWMNYIGLLSYSLYLWQQMFLYRTNYWINQFPQNIFCVIFAALFSYYIIEKPFLRLKSKFSA